MGSLRIVFMGTPAFVLPVFSTLVKHCTVVGLFTNPPKPQGRGQKIIPSVLHELAQAQSISIFTPERIKQDPASIEHFTTQSIDLAVVFAYGRIIPKWFLEQPRFGFLNIHTSILPHFRGAAPIHRAIQAGCTTTGVSFMKMNEKLDEGDVYSTVTTPIEPTDTSVSLTHKLVNLSAQSIVSVIESIAKGAQPIPQNHTESSYAAKIDKSEYRLNFQASAQVVCNHIRAFYPFSYVTLNNQRLKILAAQVVPLHTPNSLMCSEATAILPTTVHPENKKPIPYAQFVEQWQRKYPQESIQHALQVNS